MKNQKRILKDSIIIDLRNKNLFETLQEIVSLNSDYSTKKITIKSSIPNLKNILKELPNLKMVEIN